MPGDRRGADPAVSIERYERQRADWLLQHEASWHLSDRRMANALKRAAAEKTRASTGAAESSHHEGQIKPICSRFIAAGEDAKDRVARAIVLSLIIVPTVAITAGPALGLSQAVYTGVTESLLRHGRVPQRRPWLIAGALVAAVGALVGLLVPALTTVASVSFWPRIVVDVHWLRIALLYGWSQVSLGLVLTAWQIRRHGWPGVVIRSGPATPQVPAVPVVETTEAGESAGDPATAAPPIPSIPELDDDPVFEDDPFVQEETTHA